MHSLALLFTSLVVGFVAAQNSTSDVDLTGASPTDLNQWCLGELANCPLLCGGPANFKTNICHGNDIKNYQCVCNNGTGPSMIANYTDTVPWNICQFQFKQCQQKTASTASCALCGTWSPKDAPKIDTTTSSSSSSSSQATGSATSSAAAPAATTSKGAASNLGAEHVVGGAAMGLIAAVGMLL